MINATEGITDQDTKIAMINATEGITDQDTKIAGIAHEAGKPTIIVVNKWDLI